MLTTLDVITLGDLPRALLPTTEVILEVVDEEVAPSVQIEWAIVMGVTFGIKGVVAVDRTATTGWPGVSRHISLEGMVTGISCVGVDT